jgi:sugar phosphate permease
VWWFGVLISAAALMLVGLVVDSPPRTAGAGKATVLPPGEFWRLLRNPTAWLLGAAFCAFGFCMLGYNTWAPKYLADSLHIEPAAANAYASLMFLVSIPGSTLAGWVINRLKDRYRMLLVAFVLTAVVFVWSFRLSSVVAAILYMLLLGGVSSFVPPALFTLAPETMARIQYASLALAILMVGSNLGAVLGPPALGAALSGESWSAGSVILVITMSLGTIVSWTAARRLKPA